MSTLQYNCSYLKLTRAYRFIFILWILLQLIKRDMPIKLGELKKMLFTRNRILLRHFFITLSFDDNKTFLGLNFFPKNILGERTKIKTTFCFYFSLLRLDTFYLPFWTFTNNQITFFLKSKYIDK